MRRCKCNWIATTPEGFVRFLVANILPHGYRFYVTGHVKPSRDVNDFDRRMNEKFGYVMSRSQRNRRKAARGPDGQSLGLANVYYLRYDRFWILITTKGRHRFFDEHVKRDEFGRVKEEFFRDVHRDPIFFMGYSIRVAEGGYVPKRLWKNPAIPEFDSKRRVRVRIASDAFAELKGDLVERAKSGRWNSEELETAVWSVPFLPYAPVREQLRDLVRWMNRARRERGFAHSLRLSCIRRKIPAIRAFEALNNGARIARPAGQICASDGSKLFSVDERRSNAGGRLDEVEPPLTT